MRVILARTRGAVNVREMGAWWATQITNE